MASTIKVDKIAQSSGTPEFTIPTADGAANTFLKTDGSGVLSFGSVTTTALTGSTNTWIPTITAANALTGTANFTYDGNTLDVKNGGTASSIKLYCESSNAHYQAIKAAPHSGSSDWTLTLPPTVPSVSGQALTATTAGVASWGSTGKILQVVQTAKTDTDSTTSTSFVDMAGMTVTITPSVATSKVLVFVDLNVNSGDLYMINMRLLRDSTAIFVGDQAGSNRARSTFVHRIKDSQSYLNFAGQFLDSPATTSATTYKMQWAEESGATATLNIADAGSDIFKYGTTSSTITVMEVGV